MNRSRTIQNYWLLSALLVETLCTTYLLKVPGLAPLCSILYMVSGVTLAFLFVRYPAGMRPRLRPGSKLSPPAIASWILVILAGGILAYTSGHILLSTPISVSNADMLPVIRVLNQRMINGNWNAVYDPVPDIWNGIRPIYLPALWIPFAPSVLFHFDLRWITVTALWLSFVPFLLSLKNIEAPAGRLLLTGLGLVLFCWFILEDEFHGVIGMSEEPVVIFYYVLLVFGLASRRTYLVGIGMLFCLLSRYALIGWIPAYLFYLFIRRQYRASVTLMFIGLAGLWLMFILPFGLENLIRLVQLPDQYVEFSLRVWKDSPEVFTQGLGMARFFLPNHAWWLHGSLVVLSFLVPFAFVATCFYMHERVNIENIPVASLKLALVIFFGFIDVPYLYLFYTSSFVSLVAVALLMGGGNSKIVSGVQA
jgi:hypothetical protein